MKTKEVTINNEQRLFVIPCSGGGYSCLGFDVCQNKIEKIEAELKTLTTHEFTELPPVGTMEQYARYQKAVELARDICHRTGCQLTCELHPPLIGKEKKRVEVTSRNGTKRRFIVGKSTGFIPCHLEIKKVNSMGGEKVWDDFDTVRVI